MGKDVFKEYQILFAGLKDGESVFKYQISDEFFKKFEGNEQIEGADIQIELVLDKEHGFITLDFFVEGTISAVCDRCSNQFRQQLLDEHRVFVKFSDHAKELEEEDDVVYLMTGETQLNVAKLIYEFIVLSLPIQYVCPPKEDGSSGCNPKVLEILAKNQQQIEEDLTKKKEIIDPRWAALKKLKK